MESRKINAEQHASSKSEVKDLLTHMDPMIYLAGTADNTSEMLAYLADMDPAFHKLELVKSLRKSMRNELTRTIENYVAQYLDEQKGKMRSENPVDALVQKLTENEHYSEFVNKFEESLQSTVSDITKNFDDEIVTGMFSSEDDSDVMNRYSPNESCESSLNSSLNQSGFMFLHPAQYTSIAKTLSGHRKSDNLKDSLNILLVVTPGEPVMQDCWPEIRKGLRECLLEEDCEVFDKALKIHSKLLTSQNHSAVKEAFINLLEALAGFYMTRKLVSKIPLKGQNVDLSLCDKLLRILNVITEFQKELPLLWIRYPERFVDDMVESMFTLLALNVQNQNNHQMTAFDLLSLVDSNASWFRYWVHGQWGRNKVFNAMKSNPSILLHAVTICVEQFEAEIPQILPSHSPGPLILKANVIKQIKFSYCLSLLMTVISYSDGRKLFPINIPLKDELLTVQAFCQLMSNAIRADAPDAMISDVSSQMQKFCYLNEVCCGILCEAGVVESLLNEISSTMQKLCGKRHRTSFDISHNEIRQTYVCAVVGILDALLSTQSGQQYVLLGRRRKPSSKTGITTATNTPARDVLDLSLLILLTEGQTRLKEQTVHMTCRLLSTPIGIHMCYEHPLIQAVIHHLRLTRKGSTVTPSLTLGLDCPISSSFKLSILDCCAFVEALASSFRGLWMLESAGVLEQALGMLLPHLASKGKLTPAILSCICSSFQGCNMVSQAKVLQPFWDLLCHMVSAGEQIRPPLLQEERQNAMDEALIPLLGLTASHQGTKLLMSNDGLRNQLMNALSIAEDDLHTMALQLLASATSSLDNIVYLQAQGNYQGLLLAQQKSMMTEENKVIIDINALIRNNILVNSYFLGGNGEKILPQLFSNETLYDCTTPLFCQYPPPRDYIPDKPIRSMHKKQNDVWRFLSDTRHGLHDIGWLSHCRKALRTVLVGGEDLKSWLVKDIVERAVRALSSSNEELLTNSSSPTSDSSNNTNSHSETCSSSSSSSSSISSNISSSSSTTAPNLKLYKDDVREAKQLTDQQLLAVELVLRYGSEVGIVSISPGVHENMVELLFGVQSTVIPHTVENFPDGADWFAMIVFLIFGANTERSQNVLSAVSKLQVGAILWPSLTNYLVTTHDLLQGEITLAGIVQNVQLLMSIETPVLYMAIQANNGAIWAMVGEWLNTVFLGVLPWAEVCHYLVLVLVMGADYTVYFTVALMRHLQDAIFSHAHEPQAFLSLQI
ncbi:unnamed protein product, partial [Meganyctiphanes norvegica]